LIEKPSRKSGGLYFCPTIHFVIILTNQYLVIKFF